MSTATATLPNAWAGALLDCAGLIVSASRSSTRTSSTSCWRARRPARRLDPDPGLHHHGPRAEHRGRLRRAARPRLRGLLRHRRVRHGLARVAAVPRRHGGKGIHILTPAKSAFGSAVPGIHINFFFVIFIAAIFTAIWGVILGAPTLRLRGDYLAIVTLAFGEIVPRIFENSTSGIFGIGSIDFSNGRQGITPIDKVNLPWTDEKFKYPLELKPIYFVGAGDGPARHLLQPPPARLAHGARVDRRARGRGRRRGDGRQPRAHQAVGLRAGRRAGRLRGRLPGHLQQHGQRRPVRVRLLGPDPVAWSSSAAWATSGASSSARSPCRCSTATGSSSSTACPTSSG